MLGRNVLLFYVFIFLFLMFVSKIGASLLVFPAFSKEDQLMEIIREKASIYEEKPENAYIDRVFKKTPGRNGKRVLISESYKKMKGEGNFDETLLVYEEVPPKVTLMDLPPAPIYRGHPDKKMVSLLINVSWGTEYIPSILKTLKEKHIKATFFIEGKWAKENKEYVRMIHEQGHLIGSHAYDHPDMARLNDAEINDQIKDTNEIIEAIVQFRPSWFAPPSGSFNNRTVELAHKAKMQTILWTVDTIDWKNPSVSVMINRVMKNIHPGAMILMHPTEPVAQGLEQLVTAIKREGYDIDTVAQLLDEAR
ncbi:MAG TPA: polysaccharide deacetylase family protein [Pseudogracilibacillus sp.]|nr:polysaccharide deacetylase family protein [Pseudogracilibacillus sp.]